MPRKKSPPTANGLVVVFGESYNDSQAIAHLIAALRPDLKVRPMRSPTVLIHRDSDGRQNIRRNVDQIREAVRALQVNDRVVAAVLHKDCDAVEPAHSGLSREIERQVSDTSYICVPATPAWEIESWWYLWPGSVHAYHPTWRRLKRAGTRVGLLVNSKERLIRDLRPSNARTRDYVESDSIGIAEQVKRSGGVSSLAARSDSFSDFCRRLAAIDL